MWVFSRWGKRLCHACPVSDAADTEKMYDAYVSYSLKDEHFVSAVLSAELEHGEPGYHDLQMTRSICERPGSNQSAGRRRAVAGASWQSRSQSTAVAH